MIYSSIAGPEIRNFKPRQQAYFRLEYYLSILTFYL